MTMGVFSGAVFQQVLGTLELDPLVFLAIGAAVAVSVSVAFVLLYGRGGKKPKSISEECSYCKRTAVQKLSIPKRDFERAACKRHKTKLLHDYRDKLA